VRKDLGTAGIAKRITVEVEGQMKRVNEGEYG
jgi:hypothetical protein